VPAYLVYTPSEFEILILGQEQQVSLGLCYLGAKSYRSGHFVDFILIQLLFFRSIFQTTPDDPKR
jgi:hypothetical protein